MTVQYFVRRDSSGETILELSRVTSEPKRMLAQSWQGGGWVDNNRAMRFVQDDGDAEEVDESAVPALLRELEIQLARKV